MAEESEKTKDTSPSPIVSDSNVSAATDALATKIVALIRATLQPKLPRCGLPALPLSRQRKFTEHSSLGVVKANTLNRCFGDTNLLLRQEIRPESFEDYAMSLMKQADDFKHQINNPVDSLRFIAACISIVARSQPAVPCNSNTSWPQSKGAYNSIRQWRK